MLLLERKNPEKRWGTSVGTAASALETHPLAEARHQGFDASIAQR